MHTLSIRADGNAWTSRLGQMPVPFPSTLKGEAHANAVLKAVTKAKRRVTLSICGLGWLDETEVESIPDVQLPPYDPQTGEITESADVVDAPSHDAADAAPPVSIGSTSGAAVSVEDMAREAAMRGEDVFKRLLQAAHRAGKGSHQRDRRRAARAHGWRHAGRSHRAYETHRGIQARPGGTVCRPQASGASA